MHSVVFELVLVLRFCSPRVLQFIGFACQIARLTDEVDRHKTDKCNHGDMHPSFVTIQVAIREQCLVDQV